MKTIAIITGFAGLMLGSPLLAQTALAQNSKPLSCASGGTLVEAGQIMDSPGEKVRGPGTLVICGDRILAVVDGHPGKAALGLGDATIIDLKDKYVLPGLIDSHVHLTGQLGANSRLDPFIQSNADQAMIGAGYARKTLMAGFTTVADLGATNESIFALRGAIARGDVPGPRLIAAGAAVSIHGGHGDVNGYREDIMHQFTGENICSGADDCRRAVRLQVRAGADLIKITATGGVLSDTAAGLAQQFSGDELASIVDAAHRMGRKVTAHAHGVDGINSFLRAGGDSIEHGTYLDDESLRLFKASGAYLIPTLMAGDFVVRIAKSPDNFLTPAQTAKALKAGPEMIGMVRRAHKAGVKIAFGTDSGVSAHGDNAHEFELLLDAGLTPTEAIRTATVNAADHLGLSAQVGTLEPGKQADLIAVDADPVQSVSRLKTVSFVMKDGKVYKTP